MNMYMNMYPQAPASTSPLLKVLLWLGVTFMGLITLSVVGLFMLGKDAPETYVELAHQVSREQTQELRKRGALNDDEQLFFFYGYGLSRDDELVAVTSKRVAVFDSSAEQALTSVDYEKVVDAELVRDESFFTDSQIYLYLEDESVFAFLVSSEKRNDERVFEYVKRQISAFAEGVDR